MESLLPRRRPFIPGSGGEAAHAPPPRGVPRRGPAHGRTRRCLGLPCRLPPAPLRQRDLGPARSPVSVPLPAPGSCDSPVAAYTRAGLGRAAPSVRLPRFTLWCGRTRRWTSRRKVSSEERGGTGRGGEAGGRAPGGRGEGAAPAPLQEAAGEAAHRGRPRQC